MNIKWVSLVFLTKDVYVHSCIQRYMQQRHKMCSCVRGGVVVLHVACCMLSFVVEIGTSYMYVINICSPLTLIKDGSEL